MAFSGNNSFLLEGKASNYEIILPKGVYFIELWGASGGTTSYSTTSNAGGKGGYVAGEITIKQKTSFYFFVGTKGENNGAKSPGSGGYNGGANG